MAGKKYSDIFKSSNTTSVVDTDLFALERADGNTYVLRANSVYTYVSNKVLNTRNVTYINTATFTANSSTDLIICNPEEAQSTITVTFPATAPNKQFTVKCTNSINYAVTITTSDTVLTKMESSLGGTIGNTATLTSNGQVCTWISFGGVYRKIA